MEMDSQLPLLLPPMPKDPPPPPPPDDHDYAAVFENPLQQHHSSDGGTHDTNKTEDMQEQQQLSGSTVSTADLTDDSKTGSRKHKAKALESSTKSPETTRKSKKKKKSKKKQSKKKKKKRRSATETTTKAEADKVQTTRDAGEEDETETTHRSEEEEDFAEINIVASSEIEEENETETETEEDITEPTVEDSTETSASFDGFHDEAELELNTPLTQDTSKKKKSRDKKSHKKKRKKNDAPKMTTDLAKTSRNHKGSKKKKKSKDSNNDGSDADPPDSPEEHQALLTSLNESGENANQKTTRSGKEAAEEPDVGSIHASSSRKRRNRSSKKKNRVDSASPETPEVGGALAVDLEHAEQGIGGFKDEMPPGVMSISQFPQAKLPTQNDLTPEDAADEFFHQNNSGQDMNDSDTSEQWNEGGEWEEYNEPSSTPESSPNDWSEETQKRVCCYMKLINIVVVVIFVFVGAFGIYFLVRDLDKSDKDGDSKDDPVDSMVCPSPQGQPGLCIVACSNDTHCSNGQKCCKNGCGGRVCMNAMDASTNGTVTPTPPPTPHPTPQPVTPPPTSLSPTAAPTVITWEPRGQQDPIDVVLPSNNAEPELGSSVALNTDGSIVASGALWDSTDDEVDLFEWDNATQLWAKPGQADIFDNQVASPDFQAASCALSASGSILVAGAWHEGPSGTLPGTVRTFYWDGTQYTKPRPDLDRALAGDRFGHSLALSDDAIVLAVGAPRFQDGVRPNTGRVYVFAWDGQDYLQRNAVAGKEAGEEFGSSVAMSANGAVLAAGAPLNDGSNGAKPSCGSVRVFSWDGTDWNKMGTQVLEGTEANELFGTALSLSEDGMTLAVGAPNAGNGFVRVYQWDGLKWNLLGDEIPGAAAGDRFGTSVSLSRDGTMVASGAVENGNPWTSGQVRVFQTVSGSGGVEWTQVGPDINGKNAGDRFGASVALSNGILAVENGRGQLQTFMHTSSS